MNEFSILILLPWNGSYVKPHLNHVRLVRRCDEGLRSPHWARQARLGRHGLLCDVDPARRAQLERPRQRLVAALFATARLEPSPGPVNHPGLDRRWRPPANCVNGGARTPGRSDKFSFGYR